MTKDTNIIFRTTKDTKDKITKILKRNNLKLSSLLNAYMIDSIEKDMIPINIRSKMRVYSKQAVTIPEIKKALKEIIEKNYKGRIDKAYLFGSYSRGEEDEYSDIDICLDCDYEKLDIGLEADLSYKLEAALGKQVDLVRRKSFKDKVLTNVKKDEICIYEYNR